MYIVYETNDAIETLRSKYLVLALDTIEFLDGRTVRAFAIIDNDHISLHEIPSLGKLIELHAALLKNYRLKNWDFCEQAIEHLLGSFKGEIDTFYIELTKRIATLKECNLDDNWTGNILTEQTV